MPALPERLRRFFPFLFVLLWSTGFIGAKYGLPHAGPLSFLAIRYVLVILLMSALALLWRAPWPRDKRQILHIGVSGLLLHGVYLGGVFMAIAAGLPAGITALVVGMQPLITAVCAAPLLGEKVSRAQWVGLLLGFAGVALVVAGRGSSAMSFTPPMLLPALAALLGITAGTLYQKRFCPSFDLRCGAVLQFIPSLLLTAPLAVVFEGPRVEWHPDFLFALGWLVLVLSVGAIALLNLLIRQGSAVNVASLFYLTPPTTALIAWALFGETLAPLALLGMGVAVAGVYLARPAR